VKNETLARYCLFSKPGKIGDSLKVIIKPNSAIRREKCGIIEVYLVCLIVDWFFFPVLLMLELPIRFELTNINEER
jgi:hypothetical protein